MPLTQPEIEASLKQWKPLVVRLAWQFRARLSAAHDFDDIVSIGVLALWRALKGYDAEDVSGASFATYARRCILHALLFEVRALRFSNRRIALVSRQSLDETYPSGDPVIAPKSEWEDPETALERKRRESAVKQAVSVLPPHYRIVIQQRYERGGCYSDVAARFGGSRQLQQQREVRAFAMMRPRLEREGVKP